MQYVEVFSPLVRKVIKIQSCVGIKVLTIVLKVVKSYEATFKHICHVIISVYIHYLTMQICLCCFVLCFLIGETSDAKLKGNNMAG